MNQTFHIVTSVVSPVAWCGNASHRELDVTAQEARKIVEAGQQFEGYDRCVGCFNRLLARDFNRARKVED